MKRIDSDISSPTELATHSANSLKKWTTDSKPHLGSSNKCRHLCGLCIAVVDIGISNTFIYSFSAQYRFTSCSQQGLLPVQGNTIYMEDEKPI